MTKLKFAQHAVYLTRWNVQNSERRLFFTKRQRYGAIYVEKGLYKFRWSQVVEDIRADTSDGIDEKIHFTWHLETKRGEINTGKSRIAVAAIFCIGKIRRSAVRIGFRQLLSI
jgi:hypothetical protein